VSSITSQQSSKIITDLDRYLDCILWRPEDTFLKFLVVDQVRDRLPEVDLASGIVSPRAVQQIGAVKKKKKKQ
jgi:hypothetical protein